MARKALIQPRSGAKSSIIGLGTASEDQLNNELLIDNSTKDLYVGLGTNSYGGKRVRPVTYNIGELANQPSPAETDLIPIHRPSEGDTKHATLASIVALVEAETGGDTKTVKTDSSDSEGYLGQKIIVGDGLAKEYYDDPTLGKQVRLKFNTAYKVPAATTADDADALQGLTVGTNPSQIWTGYHVINHMASNTIQGIVFFANYPDNTWTKETSKFLALTKTALETLMGGASKYTPAIGDKILFSHPATAVGSLSAAIYEILAINGDGAAPTWSLGVSPSTQLRYATDYMITDVLPPSESVPSVTDDNAIWFIDSIGSSTRAREIKMQTYTAGSGIDITGSAVSVKIEDADATPMRVASGYVTVAVDGHTIDSEAYNGGTNVVLGINLDEAGGIHSGREVDPGGSDTSGIRIKLAANSGLSLSADGLKVNTIDGGSI